MRLVSRCRRRRNAQAGMSLIELMIAGVVLVVGFAGVMALIMNAVGSNSRNKKDTSAAAVAQMVLERIQTLPANSTSTTTVTDCASTTWTISSAVGGSALSSGVINFNPSATKVTNYNMQYVVCDATGQRTTYDVRWNIAAATWNVTGVTPQATFVTIGARPTSDSGNLRFFALPVTIRAMVGQ